MGMHLRTLASFNLVSFEAAKIYRMQDYTFNKLFARELEPGVYALPINVAVITNQIPWQISELLVCLQVRRLIFFPVPFNY
jgi:hypothetical protein